MRTATYGMITFNIMIILWTGNDQDMKKCHVDTFLIVSFYITCSCQRSLFTSQSKSLSSRSHPQLWVVTKKITLWANMRFLNRLIGITLQNRLRSSAIQESLEVELLLLQIKRRHCIVLAWALDYVAPWSATSRAVSGTSNSADPGPTLHFISHSWIGKIWGLPRKGWNMWLEIETSGLTFSACCHYDPHQEKWNANEWINLKNQKQ